MAAASMFDYAQFHQQLCIALCTPKSYMHLHRQKQNEIYFVIASIIRLYCPSVLQTKTIHKDAFPIANASVDCVAVLHENQICVSLSPYISCQNTAMQRGSFIYFLHLGTCSNNAYDLEWIEHTFLKDTFVNNMFVGSFDQRLFVCTNHYGLVTLSMATDDVQVIEASCKGPMIGGIYFDQPQEYFYFFGFNHTLKKFGYYYSTDVQLACLQFKSIEDRIANVQAVRLLRNGYFSRYWPHKKWIVAPWTDNSAVMMLKLNTSENVHNIDQISDVESSTDEASDDGDNSNHNSDVLHIGATKCELFAIDCIDALQSQFSVEIDAALEKLVIVSSSDGIAYGELSSQNAQKSVNLDWLYLNTAANSNTSEYVYTQMSNDVIVASSSDRLDFFHFV